MVAIPEQLAVYGPINGHLWAWKDDGEFLRQAYFTQDRRFAWDDHLLGNYILVYPNVGKYDQR